MIVTHCDRCHKPLDSENIKMEPRQRDGLREVKTKAGETVTIQVSITYEEDSRYMIPRENQPVFCDDCLKSFLKPEKSGLINFLFG